MICGVGVDITQCDRIADALARHGEKFLRYLYPSCEIPEVRTRDASFHAGKFAAKEAFAKALGCGFGKNCRWEDINIVHDASGAPFIEVSGVTRETFQRKADRIHLSISHEKNSAVAVVILEKDGR